ncbi:MAG TPA: lmo0937 family membrane protein [Candidatus Saccharimonadales bacterium]|nr:lmo0937 family membrane protein [Candidatus Saccharimonadales bacterium]
MILTIAAILALLWLLGFTIHIGGGFIHLLLIIALVVFIYDVLTRRRSTV